VAVAAFNLRNSGKPCLSEGAMRPIKRHADKLYGSMQHFVLGPVVSDAQLQGPKTLSMLITVEKLEIKQRRDGRASEVARPSH
jgi:hypothetical protein